MLSSIGWHVIDRLHFGSHFAISPHGIGIALGYLMGSWWMLREGPKRGLSQEHISSMLFWALIGTIVGARFFYVVAHLSEFNNFVDTLKVYNGGISLLGGIAGAIIFAYPIMRRHRYRLGQVMDSAAIGLPFGIFVGRIGDLIIGDHLGKPTDVPWAFAYHGGNLSGFTCGPTNCQENLLQNAQTLLVTRHSAKLLAGGHVLGQGVGVHQTALYDFVSAFFLFLFIWLVISRKVRREGVPILAFALWYGIGRIVEDFLRVDKRFFGLTGSQWTSVGMVAFSVIMLTKWAIQSRRRRRRGEGEPSPAGQPEATTVFTPPREPSAGA